MTYRHLAGRLIEAQRAMLGQRAVDLARTVDGIEVTNEGNVTAVEDREAVAALVDKYVDILGDPALTRLESAATEFEDELVLPANLGGPEELPADAMENGLIRSDADATAEPDLDLDLDDAEEIEIETAGAGTETGGRDGSAVEDQRDGGAEQIVEATVSVESGGGVVETASLGSEAIVETAEEGKTEDVIVEYNTRGESAFGADTVGADGDLTSVYLMAEDENGWETPIAVNEAILDAVTLASGLGQDEMGNVSDYVDPERVVDVLGADGTIPISFEVEGHNVTVHPSGTVRVH